MTSNQANTTNNLSTKGVNASTLIKNPFNVKNVRKFQNASGLQVQLGKSMTGKYNKGQVLYSQGRLYKTIQSGVDNYLQDSGTASQRYRSFKTILQQKLTLGKNQVQNYTFGQISQFLPWVFSQQFLFQPIRSILFACYKGIRMPQQPFVGLIDQTVLNQGAFQAIRLSLQGQPYLAQSLSYFTSKNVFKSNFIIQSIVKFAQLAGDALTILGDAYKKIADIATKIKDSSKKLLGYLTFGYYSYGDQEQNQDQQTSKAIDALKLNIQQLLKQIYSPGNLALYGKIIINFKYLQRYGSMQVVGGIKYYYFPNTPNILITILSSNPIICLNVNGSLVTLPQKSANINWLRSVVKKLVIQLAADVSNNLKRTTTMSQQDQQGFNEFSKKYLFNDDYKKVSSQVQTKGIQLYKHMQQLKKDNKAVKLVKFGVLSSTQKKNVVKQTNTLENNAQSA